KMRVVFPHAPSRALEPPNGHRLLELARRQVAREILRRVQSRHRFADHLVCREAGRVLGASVPAQYRRARIDRVDGEVGDVLDQHAHQVGGAPCIGMPRSSPSKVLTAATRSLLGYTAHESSADARFTSRRTAPSIERNRTQYPSDLMGERESGHPAHFHEAVDTRAAARVTACARK